MAFPLPWELCAYSDYKGMSKDSKHGYHQQPKVLTSDDGEPFGPVYLLKME